MAAPRLDLILNGGGWATLEISAGAFSRKIEGISYLTDALDDLLRIGIDIATDRGWAATTFDHEPAMSVLVAETAWWDGGNWTAGARLSSFALPADGSREVAWATVNASKRDFIVEVGSRDELAGLFLGAAKRILEEHGEQGYGERWGGASLFPSGR